MEEQAQNKQIGAIAVHSQYIKDLSLEIPHAPEIFSEIKSAPKIDVHVDVKSEPKGNNTYTSQLSISMNGKVEDKTLFVLELTYAAFAEVNVPAEHLEPVLMIELPRLIFPFARNVVTQCLTEGGLPPFMLNPIDFAALYAARRQAAAQRRRPLTVPLSSQIRCRRQMRRRAFCIPKTPGWNKGGFFLMVPQKRMRFFPSAVRLSRCLWIRPL